MPVIDTAEGALLSCEFDRGSPDFEAELGRFKATLEELRALQGGLGFFVATTRAGDKITAHVIPALVASAAGAAAQGPGVEPSPQRFDGSRAALRSALTGDGKTGAEGGLLRFIKAERKVS